MKKIILVLLIGLIFTAGAFAERPDGWGVGAGLHFEYDVFTLEKEPIPDLGVNLFLKAPKVPIYFGIYLPVLDWVESFFNIGVTADYYFLDKIIVDKFGWYLGSGAIIRFGATSTASFMDIGVRVPIGLYIFPVSFLEIFLEAAPAVIMEMRFMSGNNYGGLKGTIQAGLGARYWF
jgi:hypothetical protein